MPLPILKKTEKSKIKKIVSIAAGKGGVGKSFVSKEIAFALKSLGYSVGILDADLYGPSIRKMCPPDQEAKTTPDGHKPAITKNLLSLSYADFKEGGASSSVRAPIANQLIQEFLHNTLWGEIDFLIIDCPPGTGDIHLHLSQQAKIDFAILVTTPQQISLIDVRRAAHFFQKVGVPVIGLVENMSYLEISSNEKVHPFGQGGGAELSQELKVPLLAKLPLVPKIGVLTDRGFNLFESQDPDLDNLKKAFLKIAQDILSFSSSKGVKLEAETPHSFTIDFGQEKRRYKLADIQSKCPCADCKIKIPHVNPNVEAFGVKMMGHYALQIHFKEGCSNGLYPIEWLKSQGSLV